jgi:hypothetical protein
MQMLRKKLLCMAFCASAVLGAQESAHVSEVDIITNQGTFKRPVCHTNELSTVDLSAVRLTAPLASYEDFRQVAEIQRDTPSLLKTLIIPLNKKANNIEDAYYAESTFHGTVSDRNKPFCLIHAMALDYYKDDEKRFFVGHEMGHLQQKYVLSASKEKAIRNAIEASNKNCGQSIGFMMGAGIIGGLYVGGHKLAKQKISKYDPTIPLLVAAVAGALGFYGYSRYKGYNFTQPLHQEEFACDDFAAHTGKTPQEKIALAQGGIDFLSKENLAYDLAVRTVLANDHPSNYARINRLRKIADQQKSIIANITLSNEGLGLGFTVKIG